MFTPFAELSATSNFTFLTGASHPEELMQRVAALGLTALAIADDNSVAGIVRAHVAAREIARTGGTPPRLVPAARIVLANGFAVTALPRDRAAWGRLCRLLTLGRTRAPKGQCDLTLDDLLHWGAGMVLLLHPPGPPLQAGDPATPAPPVQGGAGAWVTQVRRLARRFGADVALLMAPAYDGRDATRTRVEALDWTAVKRTLAIIDRSRDRCVLRSAARVLLSRHAEVSTGERGRRPRTAGRCDAGTPADHI